MNRLSYLGFYSDRECNPLLSGSLKERLSRHYITPWLCLPMVAWNCCGRKSSLDIDSHKRIRMDIQLAKVFYISDWIICISSFSSSLKTCLECKLAICKIYRRTINFDIVGSLAPFGSKLTSLAF